MATNDAPTRSRPIAIAPAPTGGRDHGANDDSPMPYTCQNCAKRKVKCDKAVPTCSSCRRGKLECVYQAPQTRPRKRKLSDGVIEKLTRYERILREHGLLDADASPSVAETSRQDSISLHWNEPLMSGSGKFLAGEGKSRYIHGNLWRNLDGDEMRRVSDVEEDDENDNDGERGRPVVDAPQSLASDPLTGALMGSRQSLLPYHPTHENAIALWKAHMENVEPLCKILHIPSTSTMVETVSQQPAMASRAEECQLFAIYHFAVYSMTHDECLKVFSQSRSILMEKYNFAARQALVNASFLKTTEMSVLQALVLFLISCRFYYDSQTYWVLTGVAVRIAQRIGLHRDGEELGLPPFEVQMRRRLFYQLIPLEGLSSQMAGTGMAMLPDSWNTKSALNINDEDMWPGMTETPYEHNGATEMIFCLARLCVGKYFARGRKPADPTSSQFKDYDEAEKFISGAEKEVEEKYIRYCDVVNPLHFLAMGLARAGIISMRLRIRLQKVRNKTATSEERKAMFELAMRLLDTDAAVHSHQGLKRFRWHVRPLSLWGTWDSLIFVLTSILSGDDLLSGSDIDAAWDRIEKIYNDHDEILESRRALYQVFGRLTLKAWDARLATSGKSQPSFIVSLRSRQEARRHHRAEKHEKSAPGLAPNVEGTKASDTSPTADTDPLSGSVWDMMGLEVSDEYNVDATDWTFWGQLIQNH